MTTCFNVTYIGKNNDMLHPDNKDTTNECNVVAISVSHN